VEELVLGRLVHVGEHDVHVVVRRVRSGAEWWHWCGDCKGILRRMCVRVP
jgi:hypothetical protein